MFVVRFTVWYCPLETVYLQPGIQSGGWLEGEDFLSRYYCSLKTCTSNVIRFLAHLSFQLHFVFCLNYRILNHLKYGSVQDMYDSLVNKANLVHNFFTMLISFLYMFRATICPSSGETTAFMRHSMDDWSAPCIPEGHPYRITDTKRRIDSVVSPDDGHTVARNMYRKEINILRKIVHEVGFIYKIIQTKHKICTIVYIVRYCIHDKGMFFFIWYSSLLAIWFLSLSVCLSVCMGKMV